ncbi:hypothetical protein PV08_09752 [Exophiala spinifera]|uniref:Uncharacterized protein n=1 Tax=Exophiala spinifera TaxID=91928 RepID=A0A0D2B1F7_9EURO|nr:uncharacterized protein PV08_09752 [Exophiala spinifera]KIW12475.1 hypothetical protein PV08_09752 [Exophiala spinifera]
MARLSRPRNPPGWCLLILAVLMVLRQIIAFIDVKPVMEEFNIRDENSVRLMAFCMGLVGLYNIIGALEDNWNVYWFSLLSRIVGSVVMYTLKGGWENLAHIEVATAVILAACMWWT